MGMNWLDRQPMPAQLEWLLRRPAIAGATAVALLAGLSSIRTFFGTFVLVWLVVFGLSKAASRWWQRETYPAVPMWARRTRRNLGARMMREDLNAGFLSDRKGFLRETRWWFIGTGCPPVRIPTDRYEHLRQAQAERPVAVVFDDQRKWWWYQGQFYWENEGYEANDVLALTRERERRKERKLARAHTLLSLDCDPRPQRSPPPREVRRAVFVRDGG